MLSTSYRLLTDIGAPFINFYLRRRLAAGREDPERFGERFGHASRPRPSGRLIWCHGASMGEATSLLLLIEKLHDVYPDISVLLTTGTVTAARMITSRLPFYAIHQYIPIDRMPCINRFLSFWKPSLALWIESELWPNTLKTLHERSIPTVLLNARMSERSFRNWHRVKGWARELMSSFDLCLAQTEVDRSHFIALGATPVKCLGNLKYASAPLPFDDKELASLREQLAAFPLWLMSSTHRGEEQMAIEAHRIVATHFPGLLTVIVPRHAIRGEEIAQMLRAAGLRFAQRSKDEPISSDTQVYLADTMGELGLFYRLCPITVMGGSFTHVGGHNPIEPAQLGSAIIYGPHTHNFSEIVREFAAAQAFVPIKHANEMAFAIERLLAHPEELGKRAQAAQLLANQKRHILDQIVVELDPWLKAK